MADLTTTQIKDTTANPAPVGLLAFGMTTVLLNLHNAGFYELGGMVLGMGLFFGGTAQVIAGIMEWKKANTFGATAFMSYGMFWLALVALVLLPKLVPTLPAGSASSLVALLVIWGVFTAVMYVGTFRLNRALQVVFGTLTLLFFLLALGEGLGNPAITRFAGYEGIFCGASAMYAGFALVLNELYGRSVLPLGPVKTAA
jgi:succinate-acetate transporter protein